MKYTATTTTCLPDGRAVLAGETYYWPPEESEEPKTLSELAEKNLQRDRALLAHLHGEAPVPNEVKTKRRRGASS